MPHEKKVKAGTIKLVRGDLTRVPADAVVYYASPDLALGSGHGSAIAIRGGPTIQEEAKKLAPVAVGQAVATTGGQLPVKHVVHAVGPRFQEADTPEKLRRTTLAALKCAAAQGARSIVVPPMGAGFYGVPLDVSAKVTLAAIKSHLEQSSNLTEIIVCLADSRELRPYEAALGALP